MDFTQFLDKELFALTVGALSLAGTRTALGVYAASKDGTFVLSKVGAFLQSQLMGRVFPFLTVAYVGYSTGNAFLIAAATAAGAAYSLESVGAIREALSSAAALATAAKVEVAEGKGNPVPNS